MNPCRLGWGVPLVLWLGGGVSVGCLPKSGAAPGAEPGEAVEQGHGGQGVGAAAAGGAATVSKWPRMSPAAKSAYEAGLRAFLSGNLQEASGQFQRAEQLDPQAFRAAYSLGVVAQRLGNDGGALDGYQRALRIVPDYEPAIVAYALLLARRGDVDAAHRFLSERVGGMPASAAVSAALAEVASLKGDSGAAQRHAQEALKKNPDYRPAMVTLARDHYRNRRLDLALYALKGILDGYGAENPPRDPDNADALLLRGLIYEEQGERAAMLTDLRRAVQLRPDLVEARLHLARAMLEAGNADEAVSLLEPAARYDQRNVAVRLNLGDGYRLQGKVAAAKDQLEWVTKSAPEAPQAYYNLGLLYLFADQVPGLTPVQAVDKAIESFERYKALARRAEGPSDVEELITRAKAKKALIQANAATGGGDALDAMDADKSNKGGK